MSQTGKGLKDSPMKLLPHQAALVEAFFDPTSKRVILLRGDVGLGKSTTLVALAGRLLQERPTARALFLVPASLRLQFVDMLRGGGTPALLVDRYQYRAMLDAATGGEFWPAGVVAVLSGDFAKQPDIRESLVETHWDLVIADEAHWFRGARGEALRRVGASAKRVVLAFATLPDSELSDSFPAEDVSVVEWRRDRLIDQDGKPLDVVPRPVLREVSFSLSQAELNLLETVGALCHVFEVGAPQQAWVAKSLFRSLQSSPAALETRLQRLAAGLEDQDDTDPLLETTEDQDAEERLAGRIDRDTAEKASAIVGRALQEMEAIRIDSKLGAFVGLLSHLSDVKTPPRRICVLTGYLGTLYYLAAEMESRGQAHQLLHGGMGSEDRYRSLRRCSSTGAILVATRAVVREGVNLRDVTDLVLYDVPGTKAALRQVLGRFDRVGRLSQLSIHVLVAQDNAEGLTSGPLRLLREILGFGTGAQPIH